MNAAITSLAVETRFEIVRLARQPAYVLPLFAFPLAFYYLFGVAMAHTGNAAHGDNATYFLASYGAFGVIGAALFGFGVTLALERGEGWLVLRRASPMRVSSYLGAKMISALCFSAAIGSALILMGVTAGGVHVSAFTLLRLLAVLVAGAIPFCALGFAIGMTAPSNGASAIVNLLYLPLSFMGGLWIPAAFLPGAFKTIAPWTPTYHFGRLALGALGITNGMQGASPAYATDVAALAAWTCAFLALAAFGWRRDESRGNV